TGCCLFMPHRGPYSDPICRSARGRKLTLTHRISAANLVARLSPSSSHVVRDGAVANQGIASNIDLRAEFDYSVRRDAKELGRPGRHPSQSDIEPLAPAGHPGTRGRFDVGPPDKERNL